MLRFVVPAVLALAASSVAQTAFFPLKDIRPGMHGVGRTVFSGNRIEEFQVEILGVLDNIGPKESLILARLSGGPLEHTGVMAGMSGSPVFIDGRLAGAVAMAFPFAKDPIAGIRPIEDMVRPAVSAPAPAPSEQRARAPQPVALADRDVIHALPRPEPMFAGDSRMIDIATPIGFGGFSRGTLEAFAPQLRALGLEPRQGITAGGKIQPGMGNPADLKPGSMISVQLMSGDLSVGADGTVTYIDGNRVYAFGHRFLAVGSTALPFARADVITLLPNLSTSFKLSAAREWMGTINRDGDTALAGELGKRPGMVPVSIGIVRGGRAVDSYQMQMVDDPLLSPLLIQMAVYSVIDSTERTVGAASIRVTGQIDFQNAPAPVRLDNLFAADNGAALQVSLNAAIPIAYVMQSGFDALRLKGVAFKIEAFDQKKQLNIDNVSVSRREVHAGDRVRLDIVLSGENGSETTRQVDYQVPIGAQPGPLYFTVADAGTANLTDFRQILTATPHSPGQLITTVNNLHPNDKAYVRVWRPDTAFQLEGVDMPALPPSAALVLEGSQPTLAGISQTRNSRLAEMEIDGGGMVISGVKTIQVEVKE
ncbi:MAG TPA: SpoIVB peptidase S55 domain-containing protein [Bryobacteraceae bacterium]|nr:SpoIVB peptidase S55 domain-containing protein [Bryobacteraceae bacterium]